MWPQEKFFHQGLFPFVPTNVPYVSAVGGFVNDPPFDEYWLFPEQEESNMVGTPTGPMTGYPIILTKEQLAWFIFKAKTWQITASGSYSFSSPDEVNVEYQGEFSFDFTLGRNIDEAGQAITDVEGDLFNSFSEYFPNEKELWRTIGRGPIPLVGQRVESTTYTETQTYYPPEEDPVVTTSEQTAIIQILLTAENFIEPFTYELYSWVPSEEPIADYGSWMRKDALIACNLLVSAGAGVWASARSNALQETGSYLFSEDYEQFCNFVFDVPWDENGLSIPLYRLKQANEDYPVTFSDITATPITFWEYEPPPE
jgi:hypothetical protein